MIARHLRCAVLPVAPARRAGRCLTVAIALVLGALFTAADAAAQAVRVTVTDSATGLPLPGVLVTLVSEQGTRLQGRVANSTARTVLAAPAAGRYRVRVERIGYLPWTSPSLALVVGDTAQLEARVATRRVVLAAVTVTGQTSCVVDPAHNVETATVWEEARKALESSRLAASGDLLAMELHNFERVSNRRGRLLEERIDTILTEVRASPYATATPSALSRAGWVQGDLEVGHTGSYHGPDANVLLSEEFLRDHCFSLTRSPDDSSLVGLAFRPLPTRWLPDVEGVLWLDRASAELRYVSYQYLNVRPALFGRQAGGRLDFRRAENGVWIVSEWHIRMPIVAGYRHRDGLRDPMLIGFREQGGRVERIFPAVRPAPQHSDGAGG